MGMGLGGILVEVDATVGEFSEGSLLLDFGGCLSVLLWELIVSNCSSWLEDRTISARARREGQGEKRDRYARIRRPWLQ